MKNNIKKIIVLLLCFVPMLGWTANHCVRSGLTYNGDGTTWVAASGAGLTGAFNDIPSASSLTRGDTYYFADGDYATAGYTFSTTESGTSVITFKKATVSVHGTETGWDNIYGDGVATVGSLASANGLSITTGYFVFDGAVGGGPGLWESGFGFNITTSNTANIRAVRIADSGAVSNITIKHTELDGPSVQGVSTGIYSVSSSTSDIMVEYCWIHGHGEGLVRWHDCTDIIIQYSALTTNPSAEPAHHGSGATFWGTTSNVVVRWNRFRTVRGTGWLGLYSGTHSSPKFYGNIFYSDGTHDTGTNGVIYNADSATCTTNNWLVYNNSFYYIDSLSIIARYTVLGTGNLARNNLAFHCDPTGTISGFNTIDYNTEIGSAGSDPYVNASNADFHLSGATDAGIDLGISYNKDIDGVTRGNDGVWDRGTYEYISFDTATDITLVMLSSMWFPNMLKLWSLMTLFGLLGWAIKGLYNGF